MLVFLILFLLSFFLFVCFFFCALCRHDPDSLNGFGVAAVFQIGDSSSWFECANASMLVDEFVGSRLELDGHVFFGVCWRC